MNNRYTAVLDLPNMSIADKSGQARHSAESFNAHPELFASPTPTPKELDTEAQTLQDLAQKAMGGSDEAKTLLQDGETHMDTVLRRLQRYVNLVAEGSDTVIVMAGMKPSRDRTPAQPLAAPTGGVVSGMNKGEVKVTFTVEAGKKACNWRMFLGPAAPTDPKQYTHLDGTTSAFCTISDLPSGQCIWVCCAVIGTKGQSEWSLPASRTIL